MLQQDQALLFRAGRSIMQVTYTGDRQSNAHLKCIILKHVADMGPNFLGVSYSRVCLGKTLCLQEHLWGSCSALR